MMAFQQGLSVSPGTWMSGVLTLQIYMLHHLWVLPAMAILCLMLPFFTFIKKTDYKLFICLAIGATVCVFGCDALARVINIFGFIEKSFASVKMTAFINLFNPLRGVHGFSFAYCLIGMWFARRKISAGDIKLASLGIWLGPLLSAGYILTCMHFPGKNYEDTWNCYPCVGALVSVLSMYVLIHSQFARKEHSKKIRRTISLLGKTSSRYIFFINSSRL